MSTVERLETLPVGARVPWVSLGTSDNYPVAKESRLARFGKAATRALELASKGACNFYSAYAPVERQRTADPDEPAVTRAHLEMADAFVSSVPALHYQSPEDRGQTIGDVAQLIVDVEAHLLDTEIGTIHPCSLPVSFMAGQEKAILVSGEKTPQGVISAACFVDQAQL